jgi:hypothetical protein
VNKFIYQIYPLLREYVKDGILVKTQDDKIVLMDISIEPIISVSELEKSVKAYFNCFENSNIGHKNNDNSSEN